MTTRDADRRRMTMDIGYSKPLPATTPGTEQYRLSAREHNLRVQHCLNCGRFWLPPGSVCRYCWSTRFVWDQVSGFGRVYSWVMVHEVYDEAFKDDVPYNIAIVELDEGPRLLTNVIGVEPHELRAQLRVVVEYQDVTAQDTLVKFRPAAEARGT